MSSSRAGSPSIFSAVARRRKWQPRCCAPCAWRCSGPRARGAGQHAGRGPCGAPREDRASAEQAQHGGRGSERGAAGRADSFSMASSSGNVRSGTHSSNPSRQTSDSSVTPPPAALRRSSLRRTGPTGTPLMPTYHSSVLELDDRTAMAADTEDGSSLGEQRPLSRTHPPGRRGLPVGADRAWAPHERQPARAARSGAHRHRTGEAARRGHGGRGAGVPDAAAWTAPWEAGHPGGGPGLGPSSVGILVATEVSVTDASTSIMLPHLRHFIRTVRPATLSSAIWYFALQFSQRNFMQGLPGPSDCGGRPWGSERTRLFGRLGVVAERRPPRSTGFEPGLGESLEAAAPRWPRAPRRRARRR